MDTTLIPVRVGACLCPGTPHADGDFVYLFPNISLRGGVLAQQTMVSGATPAELTADLTVIYVRHGIAAWTFMDENGVVPVTPETIEARILSDFTYATPIADKADELYTEAVLGPLRAAVSKSLKPSRTNGSMSAPTGSSHPPRKRAKRSSTTTTATGPLVP